jgi:capsular polysaccharide export protein
MSSQQKFLLLQGPASPFFKKLGLELIKMGHLAWKVNFCGGDKITSLGGVPQFDYQDKFDNFSDWLTKLFKQYTFTHIILFGDTRPFHTIAINIAKQYNCNVYVYEEGYLRPDWITLEANGVNGFSQLMHKVANTQWLVNYQANHDVNSYETKPSGNNTLLRLFQDLIYRLFTFILYPLYPYYKTYRPRNAAIEYLGWAKRIPLVRLKRHYEDSIINKLISKKIPYYFFPLQLTSDAQIRIHSNFKDVTESIKVVINSFVTYAPSNTILVIKNHPFDTGLVDYQQFIKNCCEQNKLSLERVLYIENGKIPVLLENTLGTIVVNSTVGLSALYHKSPTIVLGTAIYNIPNLTYQGSLDNFWSVTEKPNNLLFEKLKCYLIDHNQINGNFYTKKGISMSIEGSLKLLHLTYCLPLVDYVNTLLTSPAKL